MRGFIPEGSFDGGLEAIGEVTGEPSFVAEPHPKDSPIKDRIKTKCSHFMHTLQLFYKVSQDARGSLDHIGFYIEDFAYTPSQFLPWINVSRL